MYYLLMSIGELLESFAFVLTIILSIPSVIFNSLAHYFYAMGGGMNNEDEDEND